MNRHAVPNATMGLPGRPKNGGSAPRFYRFDDGVTRLIKWHPSRHGAKACYSELVASRLGQLIGAPILRGTVVYVPDERIPDEHRQDGAAAGFHFGTTRMEGDNFLPPQHYQEIENLSQLPLAAVHLAWLAVGDQQTHNQFLQRLEIDDQGSRKSPRFMLIDMGQMFGDFKWTAGSVRNHTAYQLPQHMVEKLTADSLAPAIKALRAVDEDAIRSCFADCPEEWDVPEADKSAGIEVALHGQNQIEGILRDGNPALKL